MADHDTLCLQDRKLPSAAGNGNIRRNLHSRWIELWTPHRTADDVTGEASHVDIVHTPFFPRKFRLGRHSGLKGKIRVPPPHRKGRHGQRGAKPRVSPPRRKADECKQRTSRVAIERPRSTAPNRRVVLVDQKAKHSHRERCSVDQRRQLPAFRAGSIISLLHEFSGIVLSSCCSRGSPSTLRPNRKEL